ncbi:MAG: TM0106 family RecB-like putative nuclease [Acidiferrobacterales bacterium]
MIITAQDLYNHTKCAHRVYLDANGDPAERAKANAFVRLLWEMGLQAELEYIQALGDVAYENLQPLPLATACDRTAELMAGSVELIFQGAIRAGHWVGRPDLLIKRNDASSRLGNYYYEPVEIKAGRGWEKRDGKKIAFKEHYAFQIMFYRKILERIQDYAPPLGRIINVDMETEQFDPTKFEQTFEAALAEVERLVGGEQISEPVLGSICHLCHWYPKCRRWVEGTGDPSGLYFVGKQKFDLKRVGLASIRDIAAMDVEDYVEAPKKIPRMGKASLARIKKRAQVMLDGRPAIRPGYAFPRRRHEIFFDIEDDPTRDLTYLFGLITRGGNHRGDFRYFLARTPGEEESTARAFWDFLSEVDDAVFYVYSAKERVTLKRLMKRYTLDEAVFNRYLEQEYDLYTDLVVKHSDWPTYSYGIKQIAGLVGFKWRDPDPSGANSIVWYNALLNDQSREQLLQRILDYNEDDCRAMMAIRDYFESRGAV